MRHAARLDVFETFAHINYLSCATNEVVNGEFHSSVIVMHLCAFLVRAREID